MPPTDCADGVHGGRGAARQVLENLLHHAGAPDANKWPQPARGMRSALFATRSATTGPSASCRPDCCVTPILNPRRRWRAFRQPR